MPRDERLRLVREIEAARHSRVVSYITGDRRGLETKISSEVFSSLIDHLRPMDHVEQIDLLIYSTGGVTIASLGLVNLLRQFCNRLAVLVPFKAYSAGTLIALGADEIVMGKLGQLSPVDPSVTSPYGPTMPQQLGGGMLPVSVEDVVAFLDLAREEAKLTSPEAIASVFKTLSDKIHPLALGSVYRARQQIRMLTKKLLSFHTRSTKNIDKIVNTMTKDLYSHDYIINRKEAKTVIGLKVVEPPAELEGKLWSLFVEYQNLLELSSPYNQEVVLQGGPGPARVILKRAIIESTHRTDAFETEREVLRVQGTQPGMPIPFQGFQERLLREGWVTGVNY